MLILPVKVHNFQKQGYGSRLVAFSGHILCMAPKPINCFYLYIMEQFGNNTCSVIFPNAPPSIALIT